MKKVILLSISFIIYTSLFGQNAKYLKINSSDDKLLDLSIAIPNTEINKKLYSNGIIYDELNFFDMYQINEGKPNLPSIVTWILIPLGKEPKISVIANTPITYEGLNIAPMQKQLLTNEKAGSFIIDNATYSTNSVYPSSYAIVEPTSYKRGQSCALLRIYPYQYNPVTKKLSVYNNLRIQISFSGTTTNIKQSLITNQTNLNSFAINASGVMDAQSKSATTQTTLKVGAVKVPIDCNYLIITHDNFIDAARTLAGWRNRLGLRTKVVKTSEISSTYATDNADTRRTKIEAYIDNAYNNWTTAPSYLLLLGDAEFIPTWYDPSSNFASDFEYADINKPIDYQADIPGYGRMPVNTANEANNIVQRIIYYETNRLPQAYYNSSAFVSYFQDEKNDGQADVAYAEICEDIRTFMTGTLGYNCQRIYSAPTNCNPLKWLSDVDIPNELRKPPVGNFLWNGNAVDITNAIQSGKFLIIQRDHGAPIQWGDPTYYTTNINNLSNGNLRPVVWSISCQTGWFDNETDNDASNDGTECFAERFINHPTGGCVGIIAATREVYTWEDNNILKGMIDAVWPNYNYGAANDAMYRLGDILDHGKSFVTNHGARSAIKVYNCIGDPTMELITAYPSLFSNVSVSENGTSVTVNAGVSGANICMTSLGDNGKAYYKLVSNVTSYTFDNVVKPYNISVTKHNYIPYFYPQDIYIQNCTFTDDALVVGRNIFVGSNVTTSYPSGPVLIKNGVNVLFKPDQEITFDKGFEAEIGGTFEVNKK